MSSMDKDGQLYRPAGLRLKNDTTVIRDDMRGAYPQVAVQKRLNLAFKPPAHPAGSWPASRILEWAAQYITRLDAEILLAYLLDVSRTELYIYEGEIEQEIIDRFGSLVDRRAAGEPLQYILGRAEFMGLEFIVTPDVLIPRPETELLVETAINILNTQYSILNTPCILDLGTGSGNIAISLTKFLSDCKIKASDVSEAALCIAGENAALNRAQNKIKFILSDLFEGLEGHKFDIIISNPPYVARPQFDELQREIGFEPREALDGGIDGLDFYRRIIKEAGAFLSEGGRLFLEIGFGQAEYIKSLFEKYCYKNVLFMEDYSGIERVAIGGWTN